jgi:hypothetical protein
VTKLNVDEVVIDGQTYVPKNSVIEKGDIKIVILQRGWVMVGRFERNGSDCKLRNASVIRAWGTTKGLGEIAKGGPTNNTTLDKTHGIVEFDYLTVVATVACEESAWKNAL